MIIRVGFNVPKDKEGSNANNQGIVGVGAIPAIQAFSILSKMDPT
jgi:hypothetical protein